MKPINTPVSQYEWLARTIYEPSQMKGSRLLKNCMWPRFKKQSRDYPGFHEFRISVQRLCHGKRSGCVTVAMNFRQPSQTLKGFKVGRGLNVAENGFTLEADASDNNPFHAHIIVDSLMIPFDQSCQHIDNVMNSGVRRHLDNMTDDFKFVTLEDFVNNNLDVISDCSKCL